MEKIEKLKEFANRKPYRFITATMILIIIVVFIFSAFEILPEFEMPRWHKRQVLDKGDNLIWLGMELAPISRSIRKEFELSRKVKGVFVVNEGKGTARTQGVKTGDIICSINRKAVSGRRSFVKVANNVKYYDGILLDIYRDGKRVYITVPFMYEHGPLCGPNKGHWELGSPMIKQLIPYGEVVH